MQGINISQGVRANNTLSNPGTTSFGIVSLITGKRIRAGVLHEDCRHPRKIYIFDLEGLLLSLFRYSKEGAMV